MSKKIRWLLFDFWGVLYRDGKIDQTFLSNIASFNDEFKIAIISNSGRQSFNGYIDTETQKLFNEILLSGEMGYSKPNPAAFLHAFDVFDCGAEHIFFVDDSSDNVAAAQALGVESQIFISATDTINAIKQIT